MSFRLRRTALDGMGRQSARQEVRCGRVVCRQARGRALRNISTGVPYVRVRRNLQKRGKQPARRQRLSLMQWDVGRAFVRKSQEREENRQAQGPQGNDSGE